MHVQFKVLFGMLFLNRPVAFCIPHLTICAAVRNGREGDPVKQPISSTRTKERRRVVGLAFLRIVGLVAFLAVCARSATPQTLLQRWEIFAEGGASISNNHFIDSNSSSGTVLNTIHVPTSGRLFTGFRFWFNNHESLEASYSYAPSNIVATSSCEQTNCGTVIVLSQARASFFSLNYAHSFRVRSRVRPFLTAGLGRININCVGRNPCFEADPFTFNLGGGADVRLNRHWLVRVEYRDWLFEGIRLNDFFQFGATGLTHNQVPSVGLVFRF